MSDKNEDQQLLADASTLLMFATAAARQVSPASGLPAPASETAPQASPKNSVVKQQELPQSGSIQQSEHSQQSQVTLPSQINQSQIRQQPQINQSTHSVQQHLGQTALPHSEGTSSHSTGTTNTANTYGTFVPNSLLASDNQPNISNSHGETWVAGKSAGSFPDPTNTRSARPDLFYPTTAPVLPTPQRFKQQPYEFNSHPLTQPIQYPSSIHHNKTTGPEYGAPINGPPEAVFKTKYRALSPKAVGMSDHPAQKLNLSPRFLNAQVEASHQGHKRTSSEGSHHFRPEGVNSANSNLNFSLARGINVESGKRRMDNAKIAAAALAAAADIPLPLKIISDSRKRDSRDSDPNSIKKEDPASTDVEIDENRTDIEPDSESGENVAPDLPQQVTKSLKTTKDRKGSKPPKNGKDLQAVFVCPPLDSYKVEPDAGLIGCICGINEDDGFTIQCDICFRWQHCSCMGFKTSDEVPEDEYKCYFCDRNKWNKIDPIACKLETLKRLELENSENPNEPEIPVPKRKSLSGNPEDSKKRRRLEKEVRVATEKPNAEKRKSSSNLAAVASPTVATVVTIEVNNKNNPLLEEGVTAETYQSVYFRLSENDYKTRDVKVQLQEVGALFAQSGKNETVELMTNSQFDAIKFCQLQLPNSQKYAAEKGERRRIKGANKYTARVKLYSDNPKQKFMGISKEGLFISDLSADTTGTETIVPTGTHIIEYLGELDFLDLYMRNKLNQYSIWGTVKPRVVRIDLQVSQESTPLPIVIDSRFEGNESRFIRKSCAKTSNCEIRPVYLTDKQTFKFYVVTTRPIELKGDDNDEELRLNWEWDDLHPIKQMLQRGSDGEYKDFKKFDDFDESEKNLLVTGVNTMLNFVECACNTSALNTQCSIFKVKKATSYLLRSTRKASSLINSPASKSKDELVLPLNKREFVSWQKRLVDRDAELLDKFLNTSCSTADTSFEPSGQDPTEEYPDNSISGGQSTGHETRVLKVPPRKQVLLRSKQLGAKMFEVREASEVPIESIENKDFDIQKTRVPLTSSVLSDIREQVLQVLKPMKDSVKVMSPVVKIEQPVLPDVVAPVVVKSIVSEENSPLIKPAEVKEESVTEQKPLVVKKLSFADYKKKMK